MTDKKPILILPLAAALAALDGSTIANAAAVQQTQDRASRSDADATIKAEPNVLFKAGEDLLGLIVTRNADGTVVAQHSSHYSHSSHASHRSHYSSRY